MKLTDPYSNYVQPPEQKSPLWAFFVRQVGFELERCISMAWRG